ncbi:hypothetical protein D9M68_168970 [compost metagenome]
MNIISAEEHGLPNPTLDSDRAPALFKEVADTAAASLMRDGSINAMYTNCFRRAVQPHGFSVDFPLFEEMKELVKYPNEKDLC